MAAALVDRLDTWAPYQKQMCKQCRATCCSLPVEVGVSDLIRLGELDEFDREEPAKQLAKRLQKAGIIEHFHGKTERFTLARRSSGDCLFLDAKSRLCTRYEQRPETCRQHPAVGPRPGYCAYQPK